MPLAVRLDDALEQVLREYAKTTNSTVSNVVREAVKEYVVTHPASGPAVADDGFESEAYRLGKDLFGCYASGDPTRRARRKELQRDHLQAKHARRTRAH